jgi:hypothetical protein
VAGYRLHLPADQRADVPKPDVPAQAAPDAVGVGVVAMKPIRPALEAAGDVLRRSYMETGGTYEEEAAAAIAAFLRSPDV